MPEFTNAQWGARFSNSTTGAIFSSLGTLVTPIAVLEDALNAYNKAETAFNNTLAGPPYNNSVSGPNNGAIILNENGQPVVPVNYTVNLLKNFVPGTVVSRPSTTIL
ncbi:hypothetical protein [Microcoleus sp.]|uniref:hypothetical protein n=1 Tax=Microcoleus sp. TaxID=44472 RepID=UPI003523B30F